MNKLLLILSAILTIIFVVAVALNLSPYLRGPAPYFPDWQWEYNFVNTYSNIWLPILTAGIIITLFCKFETVRNKWLIKHEGISIFIVFVLNLVFQYSLLFFNRAGVNGLLSRIINPDVNGYFSTSLTIHSIPDFLSNYNSSVLSFFMHAQGHPPLAILFFYWINEFFKATPFLNSFVENIYPSTHLISVIWMGLSANEKLGALFSTFFIPLLVSLSAILLYLVAKKMYGKVVALRTLIGFTFVPSVLLFIPINDSFISIFPLSSLLILFKALETRSRLLLTLSGIVFAIGVYFSISLLPILIIFAMFSIHKLGKKANEIIKLGLFFILGFLIIPISFWLLFRFDSIQMFQVLMQGLPENRSYSTWIAYNLYDFIIFSGIPFALAYFFIFFDQSKLLVKKRWRKLDFLFVSFTVMLLLVNFSGSVRGEVARIWIPFVPFYLLPIISFLTQKKLTTTQFVVIFILQLLIVLAINEYWVTFW